MINSLFNNSALFRKISPSFSFRENPDSRQNIVPFATGKILLLNQWIITDYPSSLSMKLTTFAIYL